MLNKLYYWICSCCSRSSYNNKYITSVDKLTWSDTIPFVAPIKGGHVIKVYDGDTITIASILPYKESPIFRFSVRLAGIDSPEISDIQQNSIIGSNTTVKTSGCC